MIAGIDASRAVTSQRTGTEAYAYHLIEALLRQTEKSDWRLRLYFNHPPPPDLFPTYSHVSWRIIPFPRLWSHARLAAELHSHPPHIFFTPAHVIPVSYRGRSVATIHDLAYEFFPQAYRAGQRLYLRWSSRHNAQRSHLIIAVSAATKRDIERCYQIDAGKIRVIYSGAPQIQPPNRRQIAQTRQKYNLNAPFMLSVGSIQPRKNLVRLIQAFAKLDEPRPNLVIAGKIGWRAQPILDAINELPAAIARQIILPGFVPEQDKASLIAAAELLLYPSLYEGFGFPILEGQALGVPVLTAQNSSLPEIAGDGAMFVEAEHVDSIVAGIRQILSDSSLRSRLKQAGRANAAKFGWEQCAQQVWKLLQEATA